MTIHAYREVQQQHNDTVSEASTEAEETAVLKVKDVSHAYGSQQVLHQVSFEVRRGEWVGVIGPNGSGKSTLLSLLSYAESPQEGSIQLFGKPIQSYKRKPLSRMMAVHQQDVLPDVHFTVRDIVEMGRFPYQSWFGSEREDSGDYLEQIMEQLQLTDIADRPLNELSGGQRQRASLGKLMAQSPSIVLLDEPTTYLDIHYQVQFMNIIREWQQECGLTVVSVLHDLNIAALYCDRMLVMHRGEIYRDGTPDEVVTPELMKDIFHTESVIVPHPECGRPQLLIKTGDRRKA